MAHASAMGAHGEKRGISDEQQCEWGENKSILVAASSSAFIEAAVLLLRSHGLELFSSFTEHVPP